MPDHKRTVKKTEHGAEHGEQQAVEGSGLYMYIYNAQAWEEAIRSAKTLLNLLSLERCSSGHSYKAKENKVLREICPRSLSQFRDELGRNKSLDLHIRSVFLSGHSSCSTPCYSHSRLTSAVYYKELRHLSNLQNQWMSKQIYFLGI